MNVIHYIVVYPLLFASLFALGLAVCRLKVTEFMYPTLVCVVPLSLISVLVQYYGKAYLMGFIQPLCIMLGYWLIFKFRFNHSLLIGIIIYTTSALSEFLFATVFNRFQLHLLALHLQKDLPIVGFCMIVTNVLLYLLLHRLRWGISFIFSAVSKNRPQPKLQGAWNVLLTGLFFTSGLITISVYFSTKHLLPLVAVVFIVWALLIFLSYRKELGE
ncbi:hypothetical protein [Paenibacillus sp. tmac-D7]|uniref:hypothetical protein n=1 Tax=Paenibacillus sp. tmac-D7 TaxID=2591462 RepID=UPI0011443536|nr:hypothetical protein [Paenibacillus sp. tmac-D7]